MYANPQVLRMDYAARDTLVAIDVKSCLQRNIGIYKASEIDYVVVSKIPSYACNWQNLPESNDDTSAFVKKPQSIEV